ncbi:hypothetical protein LguiA_020291 [Lonicera macranthoides]
MATPELQLPLSYHQQGHGSYVAFNKLQKENTNIKLEGLLVEQFEVPDSQILVIGNLSSEDGKPFCFVKFTTRKCDQKVQEGLRKKYEEECGRVIDVFVPKYHINDKSPNANFLIATLLWDNQLPLRDKLRMPCGEGVKMKLGVLRSMKKYSMILLDSLEKKGDENS